MGKRGLFFVIIIFLSLIISFHNISSADQKTFQYQIDQVERSFNTPNFNSGNAYDVSFGDSVNLATGNLIVSATDLMLPGRNGLDVVVTRTYNSNIFLHINQAKWTDQLQGQPPGYKCDYPNSVCTDCTITESNVPNFFVGSPSLPLGANSLGGIPSNPKDDECSSWIRTKWVGRGWGIDYGKVKDPTTLFSLPRGNDYAFSETGIPNKGITSTSMILGNSETGIIYPSFFNVNHKDNLISPWSSSLNSFSTIKGNYLVSPCSDGSIRDCMHYGLTYNHDATLNKVVADKNILFKELLMGYLNQTKLSSLSFQLPFNLSLSRYTAFTDNHDPITFNYFSTIYLAQGIGDMAFPGPIKYAKDGVQYTFSNWVQFCGAYDELARSSGGDPVYDYCLDHASDYSDHGGNPTYKWAENPYAGMYLTSIVDKSGNQIKVNYYDDSVNTMDRYSPFISTINDTLGRIVNFNVQNPTSIDGRLEDINYPNYNGQQIYVDYVYNTNPEGSAPANTLLKEVHLRDGPTGNDLLPPTKYAYDSHTQELTQITYPNGLKVNYAYAFKWMPTSMNYILREKYFALKRVVISRTVTIPNEKGTGIDGTYVWSYNYSDQTDPSNIYDISGFPTAKTTVTDPLGNKVVHKFLLMNSDRNFVSRDGGPLLSGSDYPPNYQCKLVYGSPDDFYDPLNPPPVRRYTDCM